MPPRTYALLLTAVLLAAAVTVFAAQSLSLPWAVLSLLAIAAAVALRLRPRA